MEEKGLDVIAVTGDVGQERQDLEFVKNKALQVGAIEALAIDMREEYVNDFLTKALAAKEAEVAAKEAQIAERDARITSLSEQLGAANAKAQLASTAQVVSTAPFEGGGSPGEDPTHALAMFNMLGGVMGAFQQQVDDARQVGEQEGREAVQRDLEDMLLSLIHI